MPTPIALPLPATTLASMPAQALVSGIWLPRTIQPTALAL